MVNIYRTKLPNGALWSGDGQAFLGQVYSAWQFKTKDESVFNVGLHYSFFGLNNSQALDWRFGAKIPVDNAKNKTHLTLGVSTHHQSQPLPVYYAHRPTIVILKGFSMKMEFQLARLNFVEGANYELYTQTFDSATTNPAYANFLFDKKWNFQVGLNMGYHF